MLELEQTIVQIFLSRVVLFDWTDLLLRKLILIRILLHQKRVVKLLIRSIYLSGIEVLEVLDA